jgi:hypothetical protein
LNWTSNCTIFTFRLLNLDDWCTFEVLTRVIIWILLFLLHSKSHLLSLIHRLTWLWHWIRYIILIFFLDRMLFFIYISASIHITNFWFNLLKLLHLPFSLFLWFRLLLHFLLLFDLLLSHSLQVLFVKISCLGFLFISSKNVSHLTWIFMIFRHTSLLIH